MTSNSSETPTRPKTRSGRDRLAGFALTAPTLTLLTTAFMLVAYNATFWSRGAEIFSGHPAKLAGIGLAVYFLMAAVFLAFAFRPVVRPFLAAMLILGAVTSYYMDSLGVVIDRDMIQNVATTTITESKHLITLGFVSHVALYGVLPAVVMWRLPLRRQGWIRGLAMPVLLMLLCVALSAGLLAANYKTYASVLRERKDLMNSFQPGAPIVGAIRYVRMVSATRDVVVRPLGEDARKGAAYGAGDKPVLTVIVAGETARAGSFSLNGYEVPTNPELSRRPVINFPEVSSCGTATAVSLPCMFSVHDRAGYTYEKGISTETLLDVLHRAGFDVHWWENNTGDKGVAARTGVEYIGKLDDPRYCREGECDDGVFLDRLAAFLPTITQDTVLVMHQIGSHGPAYYLRYPPEFEKFKPACRTAEFKNCTPQEIVNAYDNTIAYTDLVLARLIDLLTEQTDVTASLIYVSDHGESLGEAGLYLHGAPYFMAPREQTHVPMIMWLSDAHRQRFGLTEGCLEERAVAPMSHDNLFHSVLGLLDVETAVRDAGLDVVTPCRAANLAVSQ